MFLTIVGFKGGIGKTTTAIHLAAYLEQIAPTLLIDGDENRSALAWASQSSLPFATVSQMQAAMAVGKYEHVVIDTKARPSEEDINELAVGTDLFILPCPPRALDISALSPTITTLKNLKANFKVLLTMVPPGGTKIVGDLKEALENVPVFNGYIKRYAAFEKAPLTGVIVKDYSDPNAEKAWNCYQAIGKEIING